MHVGFLLRQLRDEAALAQEELAEKSGLHGDYLSAFHQSQLVIRQCLEPRIGPAEAAMQGPAAQFIPDVTAAAYVGLPGALIWELVRG